MTFLAKMDCEWDIWSAWSGCTALCGGGTQLRQRIIKQSESNGGLPCQGQGIEQRNCGIDACPGENILLSFYRNRCYLLLSVAGPKLYNSGPCHSYITVTESADFGFIPLL